MKTIKSSSNEYIKELTKLKQKKYREENKMFLVEGYNIVTEAKGLLKTVLITNEKDFNIVNGPEYILVSDEVIKKVSQTTTPQGIIGVCTYPNISKKKSNKILLLDDIQDPGNIGTIMRTAIAFNFTTIVLGDDCVDIYNDKVVRASQGAIFKVNIIKKNLEKAIEELKTEGYTIVGTSLNGQLINEINPVNKMAIILGNEGNGVKKNILAKTDCNAYIPISTKMESLNVGIAAGILMYYFK